MIKSKTLQSYYGTNPNEYYIKFIHHDIEVIEESDEEYNNIKSDFDYIYNLDNKAFVIYFSNVDNYIKLSSNVDIENNYINKVYIRIRNIEEYNKLNNYNKSNYKLIVDLKDIDNLNIKDKNIVVQINTVSELTIDMLNELLLKYNIKEVLVGQIPYLSKQDNYLFELMSNMYNVDSSNYNELEKINKITNDIYDIETYSKLLDKFNNIINQLNIKDEIDGFYKIFDYIAENVTYADDGVIHTNIDNQNLIGPVMNGVSVCEGYSKYLQQLLSLIGVESVVVSGGGIKEEGGHIWNQVNINNKWYNADVTLASYDLHNGNEIDTCLVKDDKLKYKSYSPISYECDEDYFDGKVYK